MCKVAIPANFLAGAVNRKVIVELIVSESRTIKQWLQN